MGTQGPTHAAAALHYWLAGVATDVAVIVLPSITVSVSVRPMTYALLAAGFTAMAYGPPPTFTVATTMLFVPSTTVRVLL